jgi:hypothetical protein
LYPFVFRDAWDAFDAYTNINILAWKKLRNPAHKNYNSTCANINVHIREIMSFDESVAFSE